MIVSGNRLAQLFFEHGGRSIDKWEQYLGIYAHELAPLIAANQPVRLLEIGVQNGGSLELWAKYLPVGSEIIGVDIDPKVGDLSFEGNVRAFVADATDQAAMLAAIGDKTFDVIIDDGSHRSPDVIAAFRALYNRLAYGGKFIVEDMHASYWASHEGGFRDAFSAVEFFKGLVDALNADHLEDVPAKTAEELRRYNRSLARICFYDSVIVVDKLPARKDVPYRRLLSGLLAEVVEPFKGITDMPAQHVETLLFSEPQKHRLDACFIDWFADAQAEISGLKWKLLAAETREAEHKARAANLTKREERMAGLEAALAESERQTGALRNDLLVVQNSTSWRITAPLRALVARVRR
jgi:SAM-dependent methyltransferase